MFFALLFFASYVNAELIGGVSFCSKDDGVALHSINVLNQYSVQSSLCSKDMPVQLRDSSLTKQVLAFLTNEGCLIKKSTLVDCVEIASILLKDKNIILAII